MKFHDKGSPYPDLRPRPSTVNGNQSSLQQWRNTRSGQITNRLTYGRSTSKRYFQLVNPKRCFLVQHSEVDAAKLARDTGLPAEAAVVNEEGFMSMEGERATCNTAMDSFAMHCWLLRFLWHNSAKRLLSKAGKQSTVSACWRCKSTAVSRATCICLE